MKCFLHNDRDAVGVCKNCSRGLCKECAIDLDLAGGLACRNRCEETVRKVNRLVEDSARAMPSSRAALAMARRSGFISAGLFTIMGFAFLYEGYQMFVSRGVGEFIAVIGIAMLGYGIIGAVRAARMPRPNVFPAGHCGKCGYDLTGNISGICPECSRSVS